MLLCCRVRSAVYDLFVYVGICATSGDYFIVCQIRKTAWNLTITGSCTLDWARLWVYLRFLRLWIFTLAQTNGRTVGSNCFVDVEKQHWRNSVYTKSCRLWINMWIRFRSSNEYKSTTLSSSRLLPIPHNRKINIYLVLVVVFSVRSRRRARVLGVRVCVCLCERARRHTSFYLFIFRKKISTCVSIARATTVCTHVVRMTAIY